METKYEQADIRDIPKKYIDRIVRYYTGNFAPGDKVFIIRNKSERVECDKCQGKKEIKAIIDGVENTIKCIKCKGYGAVSKTNKVIEEKTIDNVYLKLGFRKDKVSLWTSDSVFVRGSEYAVDPKDIFKTYEDAEKSMKEIK